MELRADNGPRCESGGGETEAVLERKSTMKDSLIFEMKKGQEENKKAMQKLEEKLFGAIQ